MHEGWLRHEGSARVNPITGAFELLKEAVVVSLRLEVSHGRNRAEGNEARGKLVDNYGLVRVSVETWGHRVMRGGGINIREGRRLVSMLWSQQDWINSSAFGRVRG